MATKTVVCPECAEPLPQGRLACPACGALVAFVAGSPRTTPTEPTEPPEPPVAPEGSPVEDDPRGEAAADPEPEPEPAATEPDDAPELAADPVPAPAALREWPPRSAVPDPGEPQWPPAVAPRWPPDSRERAHTAYGGDDVGPADPLPATAPPPDAFVPAGAYLPPSATFAADSAVAIASPPRPAIRSLLPGLRIDVPDDLAGSIVAAGSGVVAVGFLLPWARAVIGADSVGSYFDSWGLGALMHLPVLLLALATLGLAVLPNRLAPWLRGAILPLLLGGVALGLVWPYVVGPLGAQVGAWTEVVGALLLVVGGAMTTASTRHAAADRGV